MYGFHNRGGFHMLPWADKLTNYYWVIRIEGRDKVKHKGITDT